MRVRLHSSDFADLLHESQYPEAFRVDTEGGIVERCFPGHLIGVGGEYREIFMENIHIGYGNLKMREAVELTFDADMDVVEMHFLLSGNSWLRDDESGREFVFHAGRHNLIYTPGARGKVVFPGNCHVQSFEVHLKPAICRQWFPKNAPQLNDFLRHFHEARMAQLADEHPPITPAMQIVIRDILANGYQGTLRKMYLEAKVLELLVLQLEQFLHHAPASVSISRREKDRMEAVKKHLANHLADHFTMAELAQIFGTNEYALKRNFKKNYGTTVFGYWQDVKMREAQKLLITDGLSVKAVADLVGYKNPQHFSTAFKRQFGYSPSKLS